MTEIESRKWKKGDDPRWFAVMTKPRAESLADRKLREQGFLTFFPFKRVRRLRRKPNRPRAEAVWIEVPLYPGYIFVALRKSQGIYQVNETDGVAAVVYHGEDPLEIPHPIMDMVFKRAEEEAMSRLDETSRKEFNPGDIVWFHPDSLLSGFLATVEVDLGDEVKLWCQSLGATQRLVVAPDLIAGIVDGTGAR